MAQPGRSYRVEFNNDLTAGNWQALQDFQPSASAHDVEVIDSTAGLKTRFYRVRLEQ